MSRIDRHDGARSDRRAAMQAAHAGQAAVDYLLVVALVAVALGIGAEGPIQDVLAALGEYYRRFTWSIALP